MKNHYRPALYILVSLIIAVGLAAFLFRQKIQQTLHQQVEIPARTPLENIKPTAKEATDLEFLKSANFINLKDNQLKFNFNDICGRDSQETATASDETATNTKKCLLGNSRPLIGQPVK